jgi:hypothetical protein
MPVRVGAEMAANLKKEVNLEVSGRGPVRLRLVRAEASMVTVEIGIDYAKAPVPHLHYEADYCDVVAARAGIALTFGKLRPTSDILRNKVEVSFSPEFFVKNVWGTTRQLHETTRRMVAGKELTDLGRLPEPEKVQCFRANNVFMAVLPSEAVLDFYYISPGDVQFAQLRKKQEIELEPVVRVLVSTPLLLEFLDKCKPVAEALALTLESEEEHI